MLRNSRPKVRREARVENLRSWHADSLDRIIDVALGVCDVVFVSRIPDEDLGPDSREVYAAIAEVAAWYPGMDQDLLPFDLKRVIDRCLAKRLIPYTTAAEGWTMIDGVLDDLVMHADGSGRTISWVISPTTDVSEFPDGVIVGFSADQRHRLGYQWMRRARRRHLRIRAWEGVVSDLRTLKAGALDEALDLALVGCDLVFVSGLSDVKFGPNNHEEIGQAMAHLRNRYPDRDAWMLPVDPNHADDLEMLKRIIPFAMVAEGWTMRDGALERRIMGAHDSGRIMYWTVDSRFDAGARSEGIDLMTSWYRPKHDESERRRRQRFLSKNPLGPT